MSLTLHKVTCPSDDPDDVDTGHVFTFVWDDVIKPHHVTSSPMTSSKSVESSEVKYAGHVWTVVATTRKVGHPFICQSLFDNSCKCSTSQ